MTGEYTNRGGPLNAKPETPEPPAYDAVYELAKLVATAFSDPMLFGQREGLRVSLSAGPGTSVALIEVRIRKAAAPPGSVTFNLTDTDVHHALIQALGDYAARERDIAAHEGGHEIRERRAGLADRMRAQAEAAG